LERNGGALSFGDGSPFQGLVFTTNASQANITIEVSAGIAGILSDEVGNFSDFGGVISDRTTRIDDRERDFDKQLDRATSRLEAQRTRLTQVFAKSEQAISTLQGLQASLGAQGSISF